MKTELTGSVLAGIPMPILLVNAEERISGSNAAAQAMFGKAIDGRHYITVLRQPAILDAVEMALVEQKATSARYLTSEMSKDTVYRVFCAPLYGDQGGPGAIISFEDVSHVEEAEQMRRDFVANVSHELRTPLTALMGFIETLRGAARDDPEARDRFLSIMEREAGRMNRLVHDLLSLSRVEAEERMRPTTTIDLSGILHSIAMSMRPQAKAANVQIVVEGAETPVTVLGDEDQLMQVFSNLTENAVKYGARDGGTTTLRLTETAHDTSLRGPAARIDVIDDGDGIDQAHIARLTERFYRVDSHRSRELGGTGLGLAIVKHIVNRHRGRLRITSTPGQGSCFSVVLPAS